MPEQKLELLYPIRNCCSKMIRTLDDDPEVQYEGDPPYQCQKLAS